MVVLFPKTVLTCVRRAGFTLLEITVALGLAGILGAVVVPTYFSYRSQSDLGVAVSSVVQGLGSARVFAQSNKHDSRWGFSVPGGILFQGSSFALRDTSQDATFPLPETVSFSGLKEVVYTQISGRAAQGGVMLLTGKNGAQVTIVIDGDAIEVVPVTQDLIDTAHSIDSSSEAPPSLSSSALSSSSVASQGMSSSAGGSASSEGSAGSSVTSATSSSSSSEDASVSSSATSSAGVVSSATQNDGTSSSVASSATVSSASAVTSSQALSSVSSVGASSSESVTPVGWQSQSVGILVLDSTAQGALSLTGNGSMRITNANATVVVDSGHASAVTLSGNASITATSFNVTGNPGVQRSGNARIVGTVHAGVTPTADPFADMSAIVPPTQTFSAAKITGNSSVTLNPGTYIGGITASANARVTLNPGIYYLQGGGLKLSGNATVTGRGVLIYSAPAQSSDKVSISGNANLTLSPLVSGTYAGISIYQSRSSSVAMSITGNGTLNMDGVLYMPTALLDIPGNGNVNLQCLASSRFIVQQLHFSGNGTFNVQ